MPRIPGFGGPPPQKPPAPPELDPDLDRELSELENLVAFRVIGLLDLGFTLEQAMLLRNRADVTHDAESLLNRGAPHTFVVEELT